MSKGYIFICICLFIFSCSSDDNSPKNSNDFELVFVKNFGGSKNESANAVIPTVDNGYAIIGHTQSIDNDILNKTDESYDFWILKFDENDDLQWQKTFGGSGDDRGSDIIQTSDDGYALIGFTASNDGDITSNAGDQDFWFSKLDAFGNLLWQESFGFSGADTGISIIETKDGGYLLTGVLDVSASGGEGNTRHAFRKHAGGDYWAIKLNAMGEKQWRNYYGGNFTDTPNDVIETDDNGFIMIGSSDSNDVDINNTNGSYDFWVIKISNTGVLLWERSYGGSEIDEAKAISKTTDGNYVIVGDTRSSDKQVSQNNGAADLWVIKISPNGDMIWEKTLGGSSFDAGRSIYRTNDNGFILSGSSRSADGDIPTNSGQNDALVMKIDSNANLQWEITIGGSDFDFAHDAVQLIDGSFVIVGESSSSDFDIPENKGFTDLLVIKIE